MEQTAEIVFHLEGVVGGEKLSPRNFDISKLRDFLQHVEAIINNGSERGQVTYEMAEGSVKNIFRGTQETICKLVTVFSIMASSTNGRMVGLENRTALAVEKLQGYVKKNGYSLTIEDNNRKVIASLSPKTNYHVAEDMWVDAELYYYGTIIDAGGKSPNIHIVTSNGESIKVSTDENTIKSIQYPIYNDFGVHVLAKLNAYTGEVDYSREMKLLDIFEFSPKYDEKYLKDLQAVATPVWRGVDVDEYLSKVRGV